MRKFHKDKMTMNWCRVTQFQNCTYLAFDTYRPVNKVMDQSSKKIAKEISLRLVIELLLFLASLFVFIVITDEIVIEKEGAVDDFAFKKLAAITSAPLTQVMRVITFFGSWYFLLPAYLLLIGWLFASRKKTALWLDITTIGITSTIVLFSIKAIFQRQRPLDPILNKVPGFSFPSGHSFSSFVFIGLLTYIISELAIRRRLKWIYGILLFFFAWLIAISRVYLRVHFASDVVAGFFLSIIWLGVSYRVLHIVRRKRNSINAIPSKPANGKPIL
jgi:undecaprenyl-diphosphatase